MSGMAPRRVRATLSDHEAFITSLPDNERRELIAGAIEAMTDPGERHGMRVEHDSRGEGGWLFSPLTRPTDRLTFDAVGFRIDLDAIYFDVPVLRPVEPQDPVEDEPPTPVR